MDQKKERGLRKTRIGMVISNKMDKTVTVQVERITKHPAYKKYIRKRATFKAHDEHNVCGIGDKVLIAETRPLSKEKRWRVRQVIVKAV
jgi:small subunit ribosomal protein S17